MRTRPPPIRRPVQGIRFSACAIVVLTLGLLLLTPRNADGQHEALAGLESFVGQVLETWGAPGIAMAVVKGDSVIFARGFGVKDIRTREPMDENTIFAVASTSKAFTAAALGMLVDEGQISWDSKVTDFMPEFQLHDPYVTREFTIRDLLSHRGGLPRGDALWYGSPFDRQEVIRRVRHLEPAWSFRSHYGYQNIMFLTAGELIEAVTGTSWDNFLSDRLFRPLGMNNSTTTTRGITERPNVTTPHVLLDKEVTPAVWRDFDNIGGAGAVNSSAREMAQWIRLQLGSGVFNGQRLLSDSVMKEMHTPQTVIRLSENTERLFPETHFQAYGLGWNLQDYRGKKVIRHGGSLDGMRTHVGMIPEEDLGVVVITNLNNSWIPEVVLYHVFDAFLCQRETGVKDWNQAMFAVYQEDAEKAAQRRASEDSARVAGTSPSRELDAYVGTYADSLYGTAEVSLEDGKLILRVGLYFEGEINYWHFDTFRARWRDLSQGQAWVAFGLNRQGEVAQVEIEGWRVFYRTEASR